MVCAHDVLRVESLLWGERGGEGGGHSKHFFFWKSVPRGGRGRKGSRVKEKDNGFDCACAFDTLARSDFPRKNGGEIELGGGGSQEE